MIGKLKGIVDSIEEDHVILDVAGVGYQVFAAPRTLMHLREGEAAQLFIETHVREDHIHLYGFASAAERAACRTLLGVQGVGMKMALALLNVHTPSSLARAIAAKDRGALTSTAGVGPKLAERLLTELKDKAITLMSDADNRDFVPAPTAKPAARKSKSVGPAESEFHAEPMPAQLMEEAISALVNLGYGRSEAFAAVAETSREEQISDLQKLIPASLKRLAKSA